ncbi:MAG: hypothetical protein ACI8RZ_001880 [Myxococcota bacterium]
MACEELAEVRAVDVLHHEAGHALHVDDVGDRDDVGVPQRALDSPLLEEPLDDVAGRNAQDLERVHRAQPGVLDPIDLRHAACTERLLDDEPIDLASSGEIHR